jgi:chromosomal replication initiation ATPase DnaA
MATAAAFAVPVGELISTTRRSAYVAFARQSAMYLAHVTFGLNYREVARAFGRDRTTAAHACQLIEERRDDPAVDAVLGWLEHACGTLRRRLSAPVQP